MRPLSQDIDKELKEIANRLTPLFIKNRVKKAIMFGSVAQGKATRKSDLDLMIVMKTDKRFFDRYEQFDEIHQIIDDKSVDLLIYTPEELIKISHRSFIKRILHEGVTVYEC